MITYKGIDYTPEQIKEMREWVAECQWEDIDEDSDLSDMQVLRGIERHVGLSEFIDCITPIQ